MTNDYLESVKKQFEYYKMLGEKTFVQLSDDKLFWQYNQDSNSIVMIVKHLWGNMLSRWTDFLNTDGEKEWRDRDAEFENDIKTRQELTDKWNEGWMCLFNAINSLTLKDLEKINYIRNQGHTVTEAINRQLAHYPYHVGQIVFLGKMLAENGWSSLSIPKGNSQTYNSEKFQNRKKEHILPMNFLTRRNNNYRQSMTMAIAKIKHPFIALLYFK
ncbi:MAG TPA: DUF1572 family protein [Segetibacter sp.]